MLTSVSGYIEGNRVIVNESVAGWQGRDVIVTILDSIRDDQVLVPENDMGEDKRKQAALELYGLWKEHEDGASVEEEVRNMRRGRSFDNLKYRFLYHNF